ncbi:hypothetical protein NP233_g9636 [Leucocoprinus birnbaumii]|uniref:C3H1-type domain-containing protein n=1 Tax=Leucocoprinus birnbaumii TaxID=56174 RepID=A0AAD5VK30_9AGAR|nr:hypothetical protein NP233_g9636 [Leucocoprinus birnbaumii]
MPSTHIKEESETVSALLSPPTTPSSFTFSSSSSPGLPPKTSRTSPPLSKCGRNRPRPYPPTKPALKKDPESQSHLQAMQWPHSTPMRGTSRPISAADRRLSTTEGDRQAAFDMNSASFMMQGSSLIGAIGEASEAQYARVPPLYNNSMGWSAPDSMPMMPGNPDYPGVPGHSALYPPLSGSEYGALDARNSPESIAPNSPSYYAQATESGYMNLPYRANSTSGSSGSQSPYSREDPESEVRRLRKKVKELQQNLIEARSAVPSGASVPVSVSPAFRSGWKRRTDARKKLFCSLNRAGNALCAWHDSRRERRQFPPRNAPPGMLNCGCTHEEALFEESLSRHGVGGYLPGESVRMDPELRRPLLRLLQQRYGYKDGDFDYDPQSMEWYNEQDPESWERQALSGSSFIALLALFPWSEAFLWSSQVARKDTELGMLEQLSDKPDCFRIAAKNIRSQCTETDMDADQRVASQCCTATIAKLAAYTHFSWWRSASIAMTLCEIATGNHYSIPLECQSFYYAPSSVSSQVSPMPVDAAKASQCVEWVTGHYDMFSELALMVIRYSGYLREMPQLCYAFRRWNEIDGTYKTLRSRVRGSDLAKNLYQNATLENIAIIRILSAREQKFNDAFGAWKKGIQALTTRLDRSVDRFDGLYSLISAKVYEAAGDATTIMRTETERFIAFRRQADDRMRDIVGGLPLRGLSIHMSINLQMFNNLQEFVHTHAGHMETVKTDMKLYARDIQDELVELITANSDGQSRKNPWNNGKSRNYSLMNSNLLSDEVPDFEQELTKEQLSQKIVRDNRDVVEIVGGLLVQTDALQHQHSLMFSQFSKLSGKTIELTQSTHNAILEVNNSFIELKAVLDQEQHSRSRYFWESCAMWVLERLLQFDASSAEELLRLPMLGGLVTFVGALSSVLRIVISITMDVHNMIFSASSGGLYCTWHGSVHEESVHRGQLLSPPSPDEQVLAPLSPPHLLPINEVQIISTMTLGPMALSPPPNLPPRLAALHHPSAAHTQAREPQFNQLPPPYGSQMLNQSLNSISGSSPKSFTSVEVLRDRTFRLIYPDNTSVTSSTPSFGSEGQRTQTAPQQPTQRPPREQFTAFGIPAYPTLARYNEICMQFINSRAWCHHGYKCFRIHPLDKEPYRRKMRNALALDGVPPPSKSPSEQKEDEPSVCGSSPFRNASRRMGLNWRMDGSFKS